MYNKLLFLDWCVIKSGRFCIKVYPTPLIYISEVMIPKPSLSLKVIINDSFTVIILCWHITTTIISNIVIFSSAMPVVIIFFKMT